MIVRIKTDEGTLEVEAVAFSGPLAITRRIDLPEGKAFPWAITHTSSGFAVGFFSSREWAQGALEEMAAWDEWADVVGDEASLALAAKWRAFRRRAGAEMEKG